VTGLKYACTDLVADIAKPFVIGIFIAGMITFFFPDDLMSRANDHQFVSMLIMLGAGIPMYVCATSSTPIAAALILKGLNPGAALVFLLAGPATNAATMAVVKNLFNTRALVIYLSVICICSLAMGFFVDQVYTFLGISATATVGQASKLIPHWLELTSALVLSLLISYNLLSEISRAKKHAHSH
jgi:hypothetical protein